MWLGGRNDRPRSGTRWSTLLVVAGLLGVSCIGSGRREVTADMVANEFGGGMALCVDGAFVPANWDPALEELRGSDPPDTVKVRATDGSATAVVGDRATVVIERRRLPEGMDTGHPFKVAQVIEVRDVVAGGAVSLECDIKDVISDGDDYWWESLP